MSDLWLRSQRQWTKDVAVDTFAYWTVLAHFNKKLPCPNYNDAVGVKPRFMKLIIKAEEDRCQSANPCQSGKKHAWDWSVNDGVEQKKWNEYDITFTS